MTASAAIDQLSAVRQWPSGQQAVVLALLGTDYKRGDLLHVLNMDEAMLDRLLGELQLAGWLRARGDGTHEIVARSLMLGHVMLAQLLLHGDMDRIVEDMAKRQAPLAGEFNAKSELEARVQKIRAHIQQVKASLPEGF